MQDDDDSSERGWPMIEPMLLTATETAEALRCTPAQFDQLVADGKLTPVRLFDDGEDMFAPAALADLVDTMAKPVTRPATAGAGANMNDLIRGRIGR